MYVKIISGTYGSHPYPERPEKVVPVHMGEVCDVSPDEAERLVALGVAEYATPVAVATPHNAQDDTAGGNDTPDGGSALIVNLDGVELDDVLDIVDGHFTEESLSKMTNDNLAALATDLGLDISGCKKKADYVALLSAIELEYSADDDDEEPPQDGADDTIV